MGEMADEAPDSEANSPNKNENENEANSAQAYDEDESRHMISSAQMQAILHKWYYVPEWSRNASGKIR
jgi:hypothetical protein